MVDLRARAGCSPSTGRRAWVPACRSVTRTHHRAGLTGHRSLPATKGAGADHHTARARVATAEEKPELWRIMTATGAPYDEFQAKADREIPVVVLEPG
jgi:hypothetical protein